MDQETHSVLSDMALENVKLISLVDFEKGDALLQAAKKNRTRIEYYFTCTPSLPLYILNNFSDVGMITYIDADLYFFRDPVSIFEEIGNHSIGIVGHNLSKQNREKAIHGIYNVGWVSFRKDENGLACLDWWRKKCIDWCHDFIDGERFADQKYLDDWPARFKNVVVLQNKGLNLAPWNIANYSIQVKGDDVLIDGQPLIVFHFHGLRHLAQRFFCMGLGLYKTKANKKIKNFIYRPYLETLLRISEDLSKRSRRFFLSSGIRSSRKVKKFLYAIYYAVFFKDYIVMLKNQYFKTDKKNDFNKNPKVSIITACLNDKECLEDAIKSVSEQTYSNIEYLVIDGGSTDETSKLFDKYKNRIDKLLIEKDNGTFDAMNKGIGLCSGEIVYFMNSDDKFYDARVVEKAVETFTKNREADFIYGNLVVFDPVDKSSYVEKYPERISKRLFMKKTIGHPATFFRSSCFEKAGCFDTRYRLTADYNWFLQAIFSKGLKGLHVEDNIAVFRLGGQSTGGKFEDLYHSEKRSIQKGYFNDLEIFCSSLLSQPEKLVGKRGRRFLHNLKITCLKRRIN
ncbi:glycosyltransferase family 2 protein [Candidatus Omnitrophota bacterium]